jgi:hypothetical protein
MIDLPPDYIDTEHTGHDREMLEIFYKACRSEGGTADEITLRGLKAVLALAQPEPADLSGVSWPDSGPITARAVFADGTCYLLDTQPEPEPEPEGPTASDVTELFYRHMGEGSEVGFENAIAEALTRYARPAIRPVLVAERPWEREGWCDADGECWWCPRDGPPYWQMANPAMVYGGWLLPHHALPIPQPAPGP